MFKSLLGTTLAFLLAENMPGTRLFRFIILLPWTVPIALSSITWKWMFDTQYSIINWVAARDRRLKPFEIPELAGRSDAGDRVDHRRQRLARLPVRRDHPAGRA